MARRKNPFPESWEIQVGHPAILVAGVDEVGRGCLAGPVTAGAVLLPEVIDFKSNPWLYDVNDSKALTAEKREELEPLIQNWVRAWTVADASVEEIDRINIYHAAHLAMVRAVEKLPHQVQHVLVDGNHTPKKLRCSATPIVKGDSRALSIACASILAKVARDRLMGELDSQYPGYGFAAHKGYATPIHQKALKDLGVTTIHRRSFAPVAEALEKLETLALFPNPIHE